MLPNQDEQDRAEALDADKLDDRRDAPQVEPDYPPEQPLGADEYGTSPAEEQVGEPIGERVERERADPLVDELDGGPGARSDVEEVGRLSETSPGQDETIPSVDDTEGQSVARAPGDVANLSAEEAAVHHTDDPPM